MSPLQRTFSMVVLLLSSGLLFASFADALRIQPPNGPEPFDPWDKSLEIWVKSTAANDGRFLSVDPNEASVAEAALGDVPGGVASTAQTMAGMPPASWSFELRPTFVQDYWLNLSRPVTGILYYRNSATKAGAAQDVGAESGRIRVELFSGAERVAGSEFTQTLVASAFYPDPFSSPPIVDPDFQFFPFSVRTEVERLTMGASLTLKITRLSGIADFSIGTGGDYPSYIEFRYYDHDPTAGILYLEGGHLVSSVTGGSLTPAAPAPNFLEEAQRLVKELAPGEDGPYFVPPAKSATPGRAVDASTLALAPLAFLTVFWRRRAAGLAAILLVATVLAGCVGSSRKSSSDEPGRTDESQAEPTYTDDPSLNASLGGVEGVIRGEGPVPQPLKDAHVAVLQTNEFMVTRADGRYRFENLTPGPHTLHVNAEGFLAADKDFVVLEGKITVLNLDLGRPEGPSNFKPHRHGDWAEGETRRTIFSSTYSPEPTYSTALVGGDGQSAAGAWICPAGGQGSPSFGGAFRMPTSSYCMSPIPTEPTKIVQPGTKRVTVTLTWDSGPAAPAELGLGVYTPEGLQSWSPEGKGSFGFSPIQDPFVPRGRGVAFNIPIFPNGADEGHQPSTQWQYLVYTPFFEQLHPDQPPVVGISSITVTIEIHRGIVPFEPSHTRFWNGNTTKLIFHPQISQLDCNPFVQKLAASGVIPPQVAQHPDRECGFSSVRIPPGTADIYGSLEWTDFPGATWKLAYRSADLPEDYRRPLETREADKVTEAPGNFTFHIKVTSGMTDGFYSGVSGWRFYPSDHGDDATRASIVLSNQWTLYAYIVKDPDYREE